jgi:hypothetical protein
MKKPQLTGKIFHVTKTDHNYVLLMPDTRRFGMDPDDPNYVDREKHVIYERFWGTLEDITGPRNPWSMRHQGWVKEETYLEDIRSGRVTEIDSRHPLFLKIMLLAVIHAPSR